jgi:hypothetical protein
MELFFNWWFGLKPHVRTYILAILNAWVGINGFLLTFKMFPNGGIIAINLILIFLAEAIIGTIVLCVKGSKELRNSRNGY